MSDSESIKKMLRAVLQSKKDGVSINTLQLEFKSLCGETIPLRKLGFSTLEDFLQSIPSVVELKGRGGEMRCFAAVCKETAHIAELVAKQKTSKKSCRSQVVNCRMRLGLPNAHMFNVRPRSSLRQPSRGALPNWKANRFQFHGGYRNGSASGDYRRLDQKLCTITPIEQRQPATQTVPNDRSRLFNISAGIPSVTTPRPVVSQTVYNVDQEQKRLTLILEKHSKGLWGSKLSEVYTEMFHQKPHPQMLIDLENWPTVCMVEEPLSRKGVEKLIYPAKPSNFCRIPPVMSNCSKESAGYSLPVGVPLSSHFSTPQQFPASLHPSSHNILAKPNFILPISPLQTNKAYSDSGSSSTLLGPISKSNLNVNSINKGRESYKFTTRGNHNASQLAPTWSCLLTTNGHALPPQAGTDCNVSPQSSLSSSVAAPTHAVSVGMTPEVHQKIKELLCKYSQGLWTYALPKLFADTYKMTFPESILDNLAILRDICTIDYPSHDPKKAILYYLNQDDERDQTGSESQSCKMTLLPSGMEVLGSKIPPRLSPPTDNIPSVVVTEAKSGNAVTVRYVGENYSGAQEAMEEAMHSFYKHQFERYQLSQPMIGHLVAYKEDDGTDVIRAQVLELIGSDRVKLYFVDHGFYEETDRTNLMELHQDFVSLPLQAVNVRLAGLDELIAHAAVQSALEELAVHKILLIETLQPCPKDDMPVVVLYDTSQEEDVNINSCCLKSLQDESMNNPRFVNVVYRDVYVSDVCPDGTLFCQLPSRGTVRLAKFLKEIEAYFTAQVTSDYLVSRPFHGKLCLARYKGKWARAEITKLCGERVMDILYVDIGVSNTVEVTDLREIPPQFLKDFTVIPPQAVKCRLADLDAPDGEWNHDAIQWLKELVLEAEDCSVKILRSEMLEKQQLTYIYLFRGANDPELPKSINSQLAELDVWQKLMSQNAKDTAGSLEIAVDKTETQALSPPPHVRLQPGELLDTYVSGAFHPGFFVLQPWQDINKLTVLMGEMRVYYNQKERIKQPPVNIQKEEFYAAKIDNQWFRVQVKAILTNRMVSVYKLDYGVLDLVHDTLFLPLIEAFRQLPCLAITAELAGVTQPQQWSEEAIMLFKKLVKGKPMIAQVDNHQDVSHRQMWKEKLKVFLVDTSKTNEDKWIHEILTDLDEKKSSI